MCSFTPHPPSPHYNPHRLLLKLVARRCGRCRHQTSCAKRESIFHCAGLPTVGHSLPRWRAVAHCWCGTCSVARNSQLCTKCLVSTCCKFAPTTWPNDSHYFATTCNGFHEFRHICGSTIVVPLMACPQACHQPDSPLSQLTSAFRFDFLCLAPCSYEDEVNPEVCRAMEAAARSFMFDCDGTKLELVQEQQTPLQEEVMGGTHAEAD